MKHDFKICLSGFDKAARETADFVTRTDLDGCLADPVMQAAVSRKLEVVGEAMVCLERFSPETANGFRACGRPTTSATSRSMRM